MGVDLGEVEHGSFHEGVVRGELRLVGNGEGFGGVVVEGGSVGLGRCG